MRYPKEIITLANDSGFTTAREILKSVISGKIPSIDLLRRLYPGDLALIIQRDI
ncbi:MAG: hypothetical protein K8F28_10010 [Ignavibacteriaceae bacterium]|nr:hypothetical protein [Ignavibacteriaceae bacterium]